MEINKLAVIKENVASEQFAWKVQLNRVNENVIIGVYGERGGLKTHLQVRLQDLLLAIESIT